MRLLVAIAFLCAPLLGCREEAQKGDKPKPELAPACASYVAASDACLAGASERARPAVQAVVSANRAAIDAVSNDEGMKKLAKQCESWTEMQSKNPACKP